VAESFVSLLRAARDKKIGFFWVSCEEIFTTETQRG